MERASQVRGPRGFTLVEMLVSLAVLTILVLVLTSLISGLRTAIAGTTSQISEFQQARDAFETMTRRISQATLNSYDDVDPYLPVGGTTSPYARTSELRFISGNAHTLITTNPGIGVSAATGQAIYPTHAIFFHAPLGYTLASGTSTAYAGLMNLVNTCGYYLQWNSDQNYRPGFLTNSAIPLRYRMRLMELLEPSDYLSIYNYTSGPHVSGTTSPSKSWYYNTAEWFQTPLSGIYPPGGPSSPQVHPIAENIVFLMFLPMVAPQNALYPQGGAADGTSTDLMMSQNNGSQSAYNYDSSPYQGAPIPTTPGGETVQNQLPPLVFIVMIAVDEKSFSRFQTARGNSSSDPSAALGVASTSNGGSFLTNPSYTNRMSDLNSVTLALSGTNAAASGGSVHPPINYRIFTAAVPLTPN